MLSEYHEAGKLSIVLQGGIFSNSATQVANIALEYRKIFPNAELILSISSSDFIDFDRYFKKNICVVKEKQSDVFLRNICNSLNGVIDKFVFCREALPLPPVKNNNPNCNANYQIEAAKRGLDQSTGKYVLRIRNDFLFKSDDFITKYEEMNKKFRGEYCIFEKRVMISPLFTLNPYAMERLPFHYSDWFHFGLLDDVKKMWDIPFLSLNYMTHYLDNAFAPGSRFAEREMYAKTAIEQYIAFSFFKKIFSSLTLDFHNDVRSRNESIDILLDNFCIIDLLSVPVYFPKYTKDFHFRPNSKICISHENWNILAENRNQDYSSVLEYKSEDIWTDKIIEFPTTLSADIMKTKIGHVLGREVAISSSKNGGVILFGPHRLIKNGIYKVILKITSLVSIKTKINVRITLGSGRETLADECFYFEKYNNDFLRNSTVLNLPIYFECPYEWGDDFEVVVEIDQVDDLSISGVDIFEENSRENIDAKRNKNEENCHKSKKTIYPNISELPISVRLFFFLSKFTMRRKMSSKLTRDPYLFFIDSRSKLASHVKTIYLREYNKLNDN